MERQTECCLSSSFRVRVVDEDLKWLAHLGDYFSTNEISIVCSDPRKYSPELEPIPDLLIIEDLVIFDDIEVS